MKMDMKTIAAPAVSEMRFLLLCAGQNQVETHLENAKVPGAVSRMLSDEFRRLDLGSKRTSSDIDCSFYEIKPQGRNVLWFDIEIEEDQSSDSMFSMKINSPGISEGMDRQKYRAWIGARNLHIS